MEQTDEKTMEQNETGMKYYVVTTYSGYEDKVRVSLEDRIRASGLEESFGEILIPTETVQDIVRGKKRIGERKFFPGYIFVQMELNEKTWHLVKDTPKVTNFVGSHQPSAVSVEEIARIRDRVVAGAAAPTPIIRFEEGDSIRVADGAFAGFNGVVDAVKPEKQKVVVLVSIFGRATPVELDYTQVEKLG